MNIPAFRKPTRKSPCSGAPNKPYVTLVYASLINNRGQIVAGGSDSRTGAFGAYLLTPQN